MISPIIWLLSKLNRLSRDGEFIYYPGILKDEPDERDYVIHLDSTDTKSVYSLPIKPSDYVKNQLSLGSCASHAMCTALEIRHNILGTKFQIPLSELFHYFYGRKEYGGFPSDSGMTARDMLKVAYKIGIAPERLMPYNVNKFNDKPGFMAEEFAKYWKISAYYRILSIDSAKEVLKMNYPVLLGVQVNQSFMNSTGDIIVNKNEKIYGGHEICCYAYSDDLNGLYFINSWGNTYKKQGIGLLPYEYIDKYKIDMWTFDL